MEQQRTQLEKVNLFLKGLAMGCANKIPGISGGMVAFVLGFYEELIFTFQRINKNALKLLFKGEFKAFFKYTNMQFLLLVMFGSIFSYFSLSIVLDYFIKKQELYVWSCFFGMIIGSVYFLAKDFKNWNAKNVVTLIIGAIIGIAISYLTPAKENDNLWFVFLCGIIGVSGMTLPGLSGSFILILLGNYVLLLVDSVNVFGQVITQLAIGNTGVLNDAVNIRYVKVLAVFTGGSIFGLVSLSHILGYVLKKWNDIVTAIVIGFIAGSLGNVWPWKKTIFRIENELFIFDKKGNKIIENYQRYIPDFYLKETWIAIGFILLGITLILVIDYYGNKRKK